MSETSPPEHRTKLPLKDSPPLRVDVLWGSTYFHRHAKLFLRRAETDEVFPVSLAASAVLIGRQTASFKPTVTFDAHDADDLGLSHTHARLDYADNTILVTDLTSTNGLFLDGTQLIPNIAQELHNQAALQLGQLLLRVEFR